MKWVSFLLFKPLLETPFSLIAPQSISSAALQFQLHIRSLYFLNYLVLDPKTSLNIVYCVYLKVLISFAVINTLLLCIREKRVLFFPSSLPILGYDRIW